MGCQEEEGRKTRLLEQKKKQEEDSVESLATEVTVEELVGLVSSCGPLLDSVARLQLRSMLR